MYVNKEITIEELKKMNYTEFLSFVDQWNVPPGSLSTVSEWANYSNVTEKSNVLEIACTTGFSSRELALLKHCKVLGIDMCKNSIECAKYNKDIYASEENINYICDNFFNFKCVEKFTHIILGAAIGFFDDPKGLIEKCKDFMADNSYLLVSPYYLKGEKLPQDLIDRSRKVLGITPTNFDYYVAMEPYENFEIVYQDRKTIMPESEMQMKKYCDDIINKACAIHEIDDKEIRQYMYERLYEIKDVCNEIHKRHAYDVIVLRYRKSVYPNRFVELF